MAINIQVQVPASQFIGQPVSFITASTDHGMVIINRHDYNENAGFARYGVGYQMLESGMYEPAESTLYLRLLRLARAHRGAGVVALDVGANIGMHSIQMARTMRHWGSVIAIEPQERLFYALCGNITIGNHFNAHAVHGAVGETAGRITVPQPNYQAPGSYGSLELRGHVGAEDIGQPIDYATGQSVEMFTIDSLNLPRLDFLKIDVENMELPVLNGAARTIRAHQPFISVETCKTDAVELLAQLKALGYSRMIDMGAMYIALPDTPALADWASLDTVMGVTYEIRAL